MFGRHKATVMSINYFQMSVSLDPVILICNAGDAGSIPGWVAKIPHAAEPLNPRTMTTEPMGHN